MKSIKFLFVIVALLFAGGNAEAQLLKKLGNAAKNAAERTLERKTDQKVEQATDKAVDKATDPDTYKNKDGGESKDGKKQSGNDAEGGSDESAVVQQDAPKGAKAAEMAYAKSDFVPGDEIIFEDLLTGEQLGEFPSMWDLVSGNVEISQLNGENTIALFKYAGITPLMKTPKNYLPESFTIELDFWLGNSVKHNAEANSPEYINGNYRFIIKDGGNNDVVYIFFWGYHDGGTLAVETSARSTAGETRRIPEKAPNMKTGWNRLSISFNKRALKIYVNGTRIVNAPNVGQGKWFAIETGQNGGNEATFWVKNVRIAQGAVPLYDRMMTDGKIITYGITFDIGKSTIKPESMGEINRIAKLMTDNPGLKFSVEGHTDNTGSAATNQKLSDERSAAVVAKLVEMGVVKDRLASAGKGQNSPIADNSTDEGRAKNRRVEFVKL